MGIFSFLKKLGKKEEIKEIVLEKLAVTDIKSWLEKKNKENELKEKEILSVIKGKTNDFMKDLKEKIVILGDFDIEAIKEKDQIKNVVTDSRKEYTESVEIFVEKLNNLEEPNLGKFIEKINRIFFDFNKASFKNYERVTILIGKEMVNIKEGFKTFSRDLLEIFNNNKEIPKLSLKVEFIKSKLDLLDLTNRSMAEISKEFLSLNEKIDEKERENLRLLDEIEEIKKSGNYQGMLAEKEKIITSKEEYNNTISALKQLIDFKALASLFHVIPRQMKIVKDYREDFQMNFEKDNGKALIEFLNEAKLNNEVILEKVRQIRNKKEEIANHKRNLKKDETLAVYNKRTDIGIEIDNLKIEKIKEEKRDKKLKIINEELVIILKQELAKLNVDVV